MVQHSARIPGGAGSSIRRTLFAAVLLLLGSSAAAQESVWIAAGPPGHQMAYAIDAASLHAQGPILHYRLQGRGTREESRHTTVQAEVGVDCARGLRVAYVTTTRWNGGVRTSTAHELEPVAPGSREAAEVDTACRVAAGAPQEPATGRFVDVRQAGEAASRWSGSGFAVNRDTLVTNRHVVQGCPALTVLRDGVAQPARLLAVDADADLAAIAVEGADLPPLRIAPPVQELGEEVVVLGYPLAGVLGGSLRVSTGIVSALTGIGGDAGTLQISAPVHAGNSGGPVLDATGAVAGVVVKKLDTRVGAENVAFAIRTGPLRTFLAANGIAYRQAGPLRPVSAGRGTASVVRKAAGSVLMIRCG